jgi:type II secretory pathway component PulJ
MTGKGEEGFTLIELLVSIAVMMIIGGGITAGLVVGLRTTGSTGDRLAQSSDAQLLASYFVPDVQSTKTISVSDASCGGGAAVAKFTWVEWTDLLGDVKTNHTVSYAYIAPTAGNLNGTLVRSHCTGTSTTPINRQTVARYLAAALPTLICRNAAGTVVACSTAPAPMTASLTLTDHLADIADYSYTLSASRRAS